MFVFAQGSVSLLLGYLGLGKSWRKVNDMTGDLHLGKIIQFQLLGKTIEKATQKTPLHRSR